MLWRFRFQSRTGRFSWWPIALGIFQARIRSVNNDRISQHRDSADRDDPFPDGTAWIRFRLRYIERIGVLLPDSVSYVVTGVSVIRFAFVSNTKLVWFVSFRMLGALARLVTSSPVRS